MTPDDPRHGTTRGFHAGCREQCCRAAIARYEKGTKYRRHAGITWAIPATGTQRRIQALMALGWTSTDIADACGWLHRNHVLRVLKGQKGKPCRWVERKTYRTVAVVFESLSMQIPPHTPYRARCRSMARRKGYLPPLAWDNIDDPNESPNVGKQVDYHDRPVDEVVVLRLLSGERVPATASEKVEAVRRWVAMGYAEAELCRTHGWRPGRYSVRDDRADGAA